VAGTVIHHEMSLEALKPLLCRGDAKLPIPQARAETFCYSNATSTIMMVVDPTTVRLALYFAAPPCLPRDLTMANQAPSLSIHPLPVASRSGLGVCALGTHIAHTHLSSVGRAQSFLGCEIDALGRQHDKQGANDEGVRLLDLTEDDVLSGQIASLAPYTATRSCATARKAPARENVRLSNSSCADAAICAHTLVTTFSKPIHAHACSKWVQPRCPRGMDGHEEAGRLREGAKDEGLQLLDCRTTTSSARSASDHIDSRRAASRSCAEAAAC
jgi:hypothetical protein